MTFNAETEKGSRDVIDKAVKQVSLNPSPYIQLYRSLSILSHARCQYGFCRMAG